MKIVSVITARGGSKGIPNKNIIILKGHPLIRYSIIESKKSNVHETWVSTDSKYIEDISKSYGANVLHRPAEISTDTSTSEAALMHFAENVDFDILVFIQPTSPLIHHSYINIGLSMMETYDSVFSAYKEHWVPRWSLDIKPYNWEINNRPRRQDVKELFVENGAFYITSKTRLLESKLRYSGNIGIVEMPLNKSYQLDSIDDLSILEKLL